MPSRWRGGVHEDDAGSGKAEGPLGGGKWNADVLASEAKQAATDVRSDFDQYIQKEQEAAARQEGYIRAQQEFNENLLKLQQQQMDAPAAPGQTSWAEQDEQGAWWCCWALSYENCWDAQLWYQCPAP